MSKTEPVAEGALYGSSLGTEACKKHCFDERTISLL